MRIADFGRFEGPLFLFGGAYSNRQAVEAFASVVGADGTAISTGDIVAYGADPEGTVRAIRRMGWQGIAGNCERQLADGSDDCGCGYDKGSTCDRLTAGWWPYLSRSISDENRGWLGALPDFGVFVHEFRRYAVIHGGATAINLYLWPSSPEVDFAREIEAVEAALGPVDGIVAGHSGMAFHRRIGRHQWINAGALGLPPHDGRSETRYAVLDDGEVTIHRLSYDHAAARAAMEVADLNQGYHVALTTGIWPSEDAIPPELRR